ncbi:hypothetical protein E4U17_001119 [Claviceps sp. LM77 group G4]|nr:hypothetical protein E4U17_001119 [Claviceps sp. LM77 group G4]
MRFSTFLAAGFSALCAAQTQDAPVTQDNPRVVYQATLPKEAFYKGDLDGNVRGYVRAERGPDGQGVKFKVHFKNLPKQFIIGLCLILGALAKSAQIGLHM